MKEKKMESGGNFRIQVRNFAGNSEVSTGWCAESRTKSSDIDTGTDEQQLIAANPISRAVLL